MSYFFSLTLLCLLAASSTGWSAHAKNEAIQLEPLIISEESDPKQQDTLKARKQAQASAGAVTVLESEAIENRHAGSLADLLHFVPGIWASSSAGTDATFFSSRGSNLDAINYDSNGIKFFQDGLPVTAADGNNHNRFIDPKNMKVVSIAKGANALRYGASTLGGAMDFVSPTALNSENSVEANAGSFGQRQARVNAGDVLNETLDAFISVETKHWQGYRKHSEQERTSLYTNLGWKISDTVSNRSYFSAFRNHQELAGNLTAAQFRQDDRQAEAAAVNGDYQHNVEALRVANKTLWTLENSTLEAGISIEQQDLYHPIVASPFFSLLIDTEVTDTHAMLRHNTSIQGKNRKHEISSGLNYSTNKVEGGNYQNNRGFRNGLTTLVDNSADNLELFVVDNFHASEKLVLVFGTQYVHGEREIRNTDVASNTLRNPKGSYSSINPRVGAIYKLHTRHELYTNLSKLYEAPTNYELEDDVRASNDTLDAMHGRVIEVGSRGSKAFNNKGLWNWDVAGYYARISDEILSIDDPNAPGTSLSSNIDSTLHAGIEAVSFGSFMWQQFTVDPLVSLTINHFRFVDDAIYGNNTLPAAPKSVVRAEVMFKQGNGVFYGPTIDSVDERYADFSNSYKIDGYTLLGLRAGYHKNHWQAWLEFKNLNDKSHVASHGVKDIASVNDALLQTGLPRSLFAGIKLNF